MRGDGAGDGKESVVVQRGTFICNEAGVVVLIAVQIQIVRLSSPPNPSQIYAISLGLSYNLVCPLPSVSLLDAYCDLSLFQTRER